MIVGIGRVFLHKTHLTGKLLKLFNPFLAISPYEGSMQEFIERNIFEDAFGACWGAGVDLLIVEAYHTIREMFFSERVEGAAYGLREYDFLFAEGAL